MSILNTHSKSLPQIIGEVYYFNKSDSAVSPKKGQALFYDPSLTLNDDSEITAEYITRDVWGDSGDSLPVSMRCRLTTFPSSAGDYQFAGIILEDVGSISKDSGAWVKIAMPGSVVQCLVDATSGANVSLGDRLIWDISEEAFAAVSTNDLVGAGTVIALEELDVSEFSNDQLVYCKLMTGDGCEAANDDGNMIA